VNSIDRRVFIGVPGAITDLIKLVIRQVLVGQPSYMAGRPWIVASTDSKPQVPFQCLLESVTTKETHGRLQSGAGQPGSLAGWPRTGPTCQWHLHTASSCQLRSRGDIILVEFTFSCNLLKCSNLAPMFLKSNRH
jgi:hypothetical protein